MENCGGFVPDFRCGYAAASMDDLWEFHGNSLSKNGDSGAKVARYSVEERKGRILRYLQKRNQRNFNKTIKYACRKTLADRRRRVRGRFASNNEIHRAEEEHHDNRNKGEDNGVDWYEQAVCIYPFLLLD
ncbi:zinc finger protein CONSTANS-LIKE 4 [Aristolochia californica]|uniref:zinc finger protein CONSTANS-LIKE 4 n=1 Tax=Aristolochia californica TaxID=171875 RepID=UPI0035E18022